jgi:hypothetical protein
MGWKAGRAAHQTRGARASTVLQIPVWAVSDEGVARDAWPRDAPEARGLTAFESYASMTCPPNSLP